MYNSKFMERSLDTAGCKVVFVAPSAAGPAAGQSLFIHNTSAKLVRVGSNQFLEPGEKLTVPYTESLEIVALNNGV
jgi:hypothetical protein